MIYTYTRRTKLYRKLSVPAGYVLPNFNLKMIGYAAAWRFEQIEGLVRQKQEKGQTHESR